jgi:hypothetical protein
MAWISEQTVSNIERSILEQALRKTRGTKMAADMLRPKRTTLAAITQPGCGGLKRFDPARLESRANRGLQLQFDSYQVNLADLQPAGIGAGRKSWEAVPWPTLD